MRRPMTSLQSDEKRKISNVTRCLQVDGGSLFADVFQGNKIARARAGTTSLSFFPGGFVDDIGIPERPGAALNRSHRINFAPASFVVEKSAVAVTKFSQRCSALGWSSVKQTDFADWFFEVVSDGSNVFVRDPDKTGRPRATISAPGTLKVQAVTEPRFFVAGVLLRLLTRIGWHCLSFVMGG